MSPMVYSAENVRAAVMADEERLFAAWSANRPEGWSVDPRTKATVCIGHWMREELAKLVGDEDRRIQLNAFNRHSRSDDDLYELAAQILNDAAEGKIDRDRKPHRRWG